MQAATRGCRFFIYKYLLEIQFLDDEYCEVVRGIGI
jgi:hypothetical protein